MNDSTRTFTLIYAYLHVLLKLKECSGGFGSIMHSGYCYIMILKLLVVLASIPIPLHNSHVHVHSYHHDITKVESTIFCPLHCCNLYVGICFPCFIIPLIISRKGQMDGAFKHLMQVWREGSFSAGIIIMVIAVFMTWFAWVDLNSKQTPVWNVE